MITKPMLADTCKDMSALKFPVLATPKLDGIRCIVQEDRALSRTFKLIPNRHIQDLVSQLPEGLDGELMLRDPKATFQQVTSAVMSEDGEPDFVYNVFDYVKLDVRTRYTTRMEHLAALNLPDYTTKILPVEIPALRQLESYENGCLIAGYEGVMVRSPEGPYKCGRSTVKEGFLLKIKRFVDSEAEIIGYTERMHNENEAKKDELGRTKRSSAKAGLVPAGTLGTIVVRDIKTQIEFEIGTGFDDSVRELIWGSREKLLGKFVKYKSQEIGVKEKPRIPVFLGFRDRRDM